MTANVEKNTEFGQFHIVKIGSKYIHTELIGTTKKYNAQLVKNIVVSDVKIGETIFLRVNDLSVTNRYGTTVKFEPLERLTDQVEIEDCILRDRKRVADIYVKAAQENLVKGWYSGEAIEKALLFSASHLDHLNIYHQLRFGRLTNIIEASRKYEWKLTEQFILLARSTLQIYQEEKTLGDFELAHLEKKIKTIQSDLVKAESYVEQKAESEKQKAKDYLKQLKGLLRKET